MKREQPGWAVVLACLAFFSLLPGALADLGPKPTAEAMLSVDGKPFQNALVSLQECVETAGGPNEDYSLGGLGAAQAWGTGVVAGRGRNGGRGAPARQATGESPCLCPAGVGRGKKVLLATGLPGLCCMRKSGVNFHVHGAASL